VRNLFDQYSIRENRLSHALAVCLSEDPGLLRSFLKKFWKKKTPNISGLKVIEQRLPEKEETFEEKPSEEEAERKGLPDICIHDGEKRAFIIESKIEAKLKGEQLERQRKTIEGRGFKPVRVLAITADGKGRKLPRGLRHIRWKNIYQWAIHEAKKSAWARRLYEFLEVEQERYEKEGINMTTFPGFFWPDDIYDYKTAKARLSSAMEELRKREDLRRELKIDLEKAGRGKITGKGGDAVWDIIPLKAAKGTKKFTDFPHLTLHVGRKRVAAIVIIPEGFSRKWKRILKNHNPERFMKQCKEIERRLRPIIRKAGGASPVLGAYQRHWSSGRSCPSIND